MTGNSLASTYNMHYLQIQAFFNTLKGVVLQTYGVGNAPTYVRGLLGMFEKAKKDVIIVNVTQCPKGSVSTSYAAGKVSI